MTRVKFCGLTRECDIACANQLGADYVGFVFAQRSKRRVSPERAVQLKKLLDKRIRAVGVFVNEEPRAVAKLLNDGIIDIAQLHGDEDESCLAELRRLTERPIFRAFRVESGEDVRRACQSVADMILLDSGAGTGKVFDWRLLDGVKRPYFLAGGLNCENVAEAVARLKPFGVDVSSGIETNGLKDAAKMKKFIELVRERQ